MNPRRAADCSVLIILALVGPVRAFALPEDAEQPIDVDYVSTDMYLNEGLVVYHGTAQEPACITQGSLKICGVEIRVEQGDGGELEKVTANGVPARFQQQPDANKGIVHASGTTLVFDNVAQIVTADGNAEFSQSGAVLKHQHIEYDIESGRASANSSNGERGQMTYPPKPADE